MGRPKTLPDGMRKRGKVYYACFRHKGKVIQRKLSSVYDTACEILNDLRARLDKSDFGLLDNNYPYDDLKAEFLRWARQSVRNPGDYKRDLERIEKYCRVTSVRQITPAYVMGYREWRLTQDKGEVSAQPGKEWKATKGKKVSPRTVNREVATLQNMLNKAVDWGKVSSNPLSSLKPLEPGDARKQRRSLSAEEVQAIFDEAPEYLKSVLRLFAVAAIRRCELVELLFSDIDFERRSITIRASVAKSKRAREISIDDDTIAMLQDLRDRAKHRQAVPGNTKAFSRDHVFVTAANTPLRNNLLRAFYSVCKRAGIAGGHQGGSVDLHSLRVTSASLMMEHGANPRAVQAILGHSTLELTMKIYAKATEKTKRDAVAVLPFVAKVSPPDHVISLPKVATAHPSSAGKLESKAL